MLHTKKTVQSEKDDVTGTGRGGFLVDQHLAIPDVPEPSTQGHSGRSDGAGQEGSLTTSSYKGKV